MSHLLSCPSCGLFGWRRYQRARSAAQMAERGLVAYWQGLGARSRAERAATARLGIKPDQPWILLDAGAGRCVRYALAPAGPALPTGIASAYRHLDHAIAGGENAPSGPQSA